MSAQLNSLECSNCARMYHQHSSSQLDMANMNRNHIHLLD